MPETRELDTLPTIEGWRNYPTWITVVWLDNDEANAEDRDDMLEAAINSDNPQATLEAALKKWVNDRTETDNTFTGDLMQWAAAYIHFDDIAAAYLADYKLEHPSDLNPAPRSA